MKKEVTSRSGNVYNISLFNEEMLEAALYEATSIEFELCELKRFAEPEFATPGLVGTVNYKGTRILDGEDPNKYINCIEEIINDYEELVEKQKEHKINDIKAKKKFKDWSGILL